MKLFSGTASLVLTSKIEDILGISISKSEVVRFGNSEVRVRVNDDVSDENCVIIQSTSNPTDTRLMEFFFFCDCLKRLEAKKIIGVIPYFGYARQDIQHRPGECVSANVVIRFIESLGFSKIYTIDIHDEATEGVFSIPFKNLSALPLLAGQIKNEINSPKDVAIVSPDQGGIERARKFGESFFGNNNFPLSVIEKKRNLTMIHESEALELYGNVDGYTVILVDDIITSGKTLINAANLCLKRGAKRVLAAIVHHDFTEDCPKKIQESSIEKLYTTDSIHLRDGEQFEKLFEVSVAPLIANTLSRLS